MDEDTFHRARSAHERWVLAFDTSEANVKELWAARDELERLLQQHWSAIEFESPPKVVQRPEDESAIWDDDDVQPLQADPAADPMPKKNMHWIYVYISVYCCRTRIVYQQLIRKGMHTHALSSLKIWPQTTY